METYGGQSSHTLRDLEEHLGELVQSQYVLTVSVLLKDISNLFDVDLSRWELAIHDLQSPSSVFLIDEKKGN